MEPAATLDLRLPAETAARFTPLFSAGVGIATRTGIPLVKLLCDQLGIDEKYLDQRVQTIFVNARAVDDVTRLTVDDGDVIALSAAMPGLVGATLRKGGVLASFRAAISYSSGGGQGGGAGFTVVTLKLFNLVARELAAAILRGGIWIKGGRLAAFLEQTTPPPDDTMSVRWNGKPVQSDRWTALPWPEGWVELRVETLTV
ncbi:hypothetical protein [Desulfatitalea alkaliphila]|uniref:Uncharacterized protein n=1 Tax=Desulfatitalea alkaliphila TaxID=2929485 RepID=A0AA41R248_9BACT|nr:hypothetical protein [Desulfatitalea alkaliphila]MCJ8499885.1 hypothetical protein [Desulfatitalea alkaliphila]